MRSRRLVMWILLWSVSSASAHINIGINIPVYPEFVRVPGYPVYYTSHLDLNFFFYDGMYWVYQDDDWYASYWYNGPWEFVDPWDVPLFILRIPVRYYRYPPPYFHGWHHDAPPHWGERWGSEWERHRHGWDRWDQRSAPRPAPLPLYQRGYPRDRYPHDEDEQRAIHGQSYLYRPHEEVVRERYEDHHRDHDRDGGPARNWGGNRDRDREQGADPGRGYDDRWAPQERTYREHDKPRTDRTESPRPEGELPRPAPIPDQREPAVDRARSRQGQGQAQPLQPERQRQQQEQREQQEQQRHEQGQQHEQQRQLKEQQAQQLQLQRRDERQRQQEQRQQEQQRQQQPEQQPEQQQRREQRQQQEQPQQQELQRQRQDQQRWQKQPEQRQAPTTELQSPRSNPGNVQAGESASQAPGWRRGGNRDKGDAQDQ